MARYRSFEGGRPERSLVLCSGGVRHRVWRAMRRTCNSDSVVKSGLEVRVYKSLAGKDGGAVILALAVCDSSGPFLFAFFLCDGSV